jgi:hypothetical protein
LERPALRPLSPTCRSGDLSRAPQRSSGASHGEINEARAKVWKGKGTFHREVFTGRSRDQGETLVDLLT